MYPNYFIYFLFFNSQIKLNFLMTTLDKIDQDEEIDNK